MSATLIPAAVNDLLSPGDHGTTFGGGPTTATAALYVLDRLTEPEFLPRVRRAAEVLHQELQSMADEFPWIVNLRGRGLLRGLQIDLGPDQDRLFPEILSVARDQGLLILRSGSDVVRIAPPLIIRDSEVRRGIDLLRSTMKTINSRRNA
jgi:acetylornithine/N-succinyldiaminopimelate aminotransferase